MDLLNKIQRELKAPKSQFNSFGKYNYRNCEDILEAVKPLLGDGVLTLSDEIVQLGDRFYVKATATLQYPIKGTGGEFNPENAVRVTAYAREALDKKGMDEAQITGAASSYARKYALNGLFCIDDTKDADHDETPKVEKATADYKKPWQGPTDAEKKKVIAVALEKKALMKPTSKEEYEQLCESNTGLKLEPVNYDEIIKILSK